MSGDEQRCYFRGQQFVYENTNHQCGDCCDSSKLDNSVVTTKTYNDDALSRLTNSRQIGKHRTRSAPLFVSTASWSPSSGEKYPSSATSSRSSSDKSTCSAEPLSSSGVSSLPLLSATPTSPFKKRDLFGNGRWRAQSNSYRK